jgi:hypothetical protein
MMTTASARPKEKKTVATMRAAPVMRRPVALDAKGHGNQVVPRALVLFLNAAEEHHLVVHRESEQDAEHYNGGWLCLSGLG